MLPVFAVGRSIVAEERWHGRCFAATPHRVVASDPHELVTQVPAGTVSVMGSNVGLPEAAGLDRSSRKLVAMQTRRVWPRVIAEAPAKLYVFTADRWSRVNLGWDVDGAFLGWYVNFERPALATPSGLVSKDLVLDLFVQPDGSWAWKDREDFDRAIALGLIAPALEATLLEEADRVLLELRDGRGAFDPKWRDRDPGGTEPPRLPAAFLPDGEAWAWALAAPPGVD